MHLQNSLNIAITIVFLLFLFLFSSFYFPRPSFFSFTIIASSFLSPTPSYTLLFFFFCFFTSSFSSISPSPHLHPFFSSPFLLFFLNFTSSFQNHLLISSYPHNVSCRSFRYDFVTSPQQPTDIHPSPNVNFNILRQSRHVSFLRVTQHLCVSWITKN
ncbi:unnamed protein product [Acanthosepion pharaonis]|uniref:Uncharacterized protein n=1 Tax=Acanthosepion pharaonis TaxID=158019 RepID=A0A812CLN4_ACAPH|nr:unnamed protein product [Sepia pharaonis]